MGNLRAAVRFGGRLKLFIIAYSSSYQIHYTNETSEEFCRQMRICTLASARSLHDRNQIVHVKDGENKLFPHVQVKMFAGFHLSSFHFNFKKWTVGDEYCQVVGVDVIVKVISGI